MSRQIRLRANLPFSLKATALSHGWHECQPASWCEAVECFQSIERIGQRVFRVGVVEETRSASTVTLRMQVDGDVSREESSRLAARLRRCLKLDHDLNEFYSLCRSHDVLEPVPRIGAGRMFHSYSMTENIIKAICATNVNWTQAVKMINRLAQLGPHIAHFRSQTAWPSAREILRAGEKYLLEVCRLGYRTDSILSLCDDVARGRIDPDALYIQGDDLTVPTEEILTVLLGLKGVGPATAHFLLTCLGRYDRVSIDSATVEHARVMHFGGRKPTVAQIEKVYAPYGRWKNLVYWFENWMTWETAQLLAAPPKATKSKVTKSKVTKSKVMKSKAGRSKLAGKRRKA